MTMDQHEWQTVTITPALLSASAGVTHRYASGNVAWLLGRAANVWGQGERLPKCGYLNVVMGTWKAGSSYFCSRKTPPKPGI